MYSKVYWLTCDPTKTQAFFNHYDLVISPAVRSAGNHEHIAHQFIEAGVGKWLLIANYSSKVAAESYASTVQELIKPLVVDCGVNLEVMTTGDVTRYN